MPPGLQQSGAENGTNPDPHSLVIQKRGFALLALVCAFFALASVAYAQQQVQQHGAGRSWADTQRDSVVAMARQQVGRRYVFGGTTPERGFDCSGFLQYIARAVGVRLPRTAAEQARAGQEVPRDRSRLLPGDLLTFGRGGRVTHVGIYVGGGRYIHASTGARRIVESSLDRPQSRLVRAWYGVRRFLTGGDSTSAVAANEQRPRDRS